MTNNQPRGYPLLLTFPRPTLGKIVTSCAVRAVSIAADHFLPWRVFWRWQLRRVQARCTDLRLEARRLSWIYEREQNHAAKAAIGHQHDEVYGRYLLRCAERRQLKDKLGIAEE